MACFHPKPEFLVTLPKLFLQELQGCPSLGVTSVLALYLALFCICLFLLTIPNTSITSSWQDCCLKHPSLYPWDWNKLLESHLQYLPAHLERAFNCIWEFYWMSQWICSQDHCFFIILSVLGLSSPSFYTSHLITSSSFPWTLAVLPNKGYQPTSTPFCSSLKPATLLLLYIQILYTHKDMAPNYFPLSCLCHQFLFCFQKCFQGHRIHPNVVDLGKKQLLAPRSIFLSLFFSLKYIKKLLPCCTSHLLFIVVQIGSVILLYWNM